MSESAWTAHPGSSRERLSRDLWVSLINHPRCKPHGPGSQVHPSGFVVLSHLCYIAWDFPCWGLINLLIVLAGSVHDLELFLVLQRLQIFLMRSTLVDLLFLQSLHLYHRPMSSTEPSAPSESVPVDSTPLSLLRCLPAQLLTASATHPATQSPERETPAHPWPVLSKRPRQSTKPWAPAAPVHVTAAQRAPHGGSLAHARHSNAAGSGSLSPSLSWFGFYTKRVRKVCEGTVWQWGSEVRQFPVA